MSNGTLLEQIKTMLHNEGISDEVINRFINVVNNDDIDVTFGLVQTVVGDKLELAHEIFEIVKQIENNKIKNITASSKNLKEETVKSISWDELTSLADFANMFHIDHALILKLISEYKLTKTISTEVLNAIYCNESIYNIINMGINLTENDKEQLKEAFASDFKEYVECVLKREPIRVNDAISNLKKQKIEESKNIEENQKVEKEQASKEMAFELLNTSTEDLKRDMDSLLELDLSSDLYDKLNVDYKILEKNIIHITGNYIGKKVELTENDNQIYQQANKVFNDASKFVTLQDKISSLLDSKINTLYNIIKNEHEFTLEQIEELKAIEKKLQEFPSLNYKLHGLPNNEDVDDIYKFIDETNGKIITLVNSFKDLLTSQLVEDDRTNEINVIENMGLINFVGTNDNVNKFNFMIELKNMLPSFNKKANIDEETPSNSIDDVNNYIINNIFPKPTVPIAIRMSRALKIPQPPLQSFEYYTPKVVNPIIEKNDDKVNDFVENISTENIIDEAKKLDDDINDLRKKILDENLSSEDLKRYKKIIEFKVNCKIALLKKGFATTKKIEVKNEKTELLSHDVNSMIEQFKGLVMELTKDGIDVVEMARYISNNYLPEDENKLKK